jgi:hypothetical protein
MAGDLTHPRVFSQRPQGSFREGVPERWVAALMRRRERGLGLAELDHAEKEVKVGSTHDYGE